MALAGFVLTNDFGDPAAEARACRADCALFDFSFLECARLQGPRARGVIEAFAGRRLDALAQRQIVYALRLDAGGNVVADLTIWRTGPQAFEVMSGRRDDIAALLELAGPQIQVTDLTAQRATFAAQGPGTFEALRNLGDGDVIRRLQYFTFDHTGLAGIPCMIGRLGYTGEPGFEIIVAHGQACDLWRTLSRHLRPAGFVAADLLRIEAGFPLFTNEFSLPVRPAEAGLARFHGAGDQPGCAIKLVSFHADASDLPSLSWPWRPARAPERPARPGELAVTSACDSVVAGGVLGLGYALAGTTPSTPLRDPTGIFRNIRLTALPFYDTAKRRPRAPWR
jgi:glycine cleavage system T protein (aminomethyltransferase)